MDTRKFEVTQVAGGIALQGSIALRALRPGVVDLGASVKAVTEVPPQVCRILEAGAESAKRGALLGIGAGQTRPRGYPAGPCEGMETVKIQ